MYEWKECFPEPQDHDAKVWRYMDLQKLISLLHTKSLFFARVDRLEDPFEGSSPQGVVAYREKLLDQIRNDPQYDGNPNLRKELLDSHNVIPNNYEKMLKCTAVNCWHRNPTESMAMWKLYLSGGDGIAIQSTYRRLKNSFAITNEIVNIGCVTYIDYDSGLFNSTDVDYRFMHKEKCFEHEREVRCLLHKWPDNIQDPPVIGNGISIPIEIDTLIESVYVSPASADWFLDVVNVTLKNFWKETPAIKSKLKTPPIY